MKRQTSYKPRKSTLPKGRWERVWLTPEFIAWCKARHLRPGNMASTLTYNFALEHPDRAIQFKGTKPLDVEKYYDLEE